MTAWPVDTHRSFIQLAVCQRWEHLGPSQKRVMAVLEREGNMELMRLPRIVAKGEDGMVFHTR